MSVIFRIVANESDESGERFHHKSGKSLLNECDVASCVKRKSVDFVVICARMVDEIHQLLTLNCIEASSIYVREFQRDDIIFSFNEIQTSNWNFFHFLF